MWCGGGGGGRPGWRWQWWGDKKFPKESPPPWFLLPTCFQILQRTWPSGSFGTHYNLEHCSASECHGTIWSGLGYHTWGLLQGELAFSDTHKAFLLLAVLTQLFGVEVGDFPHPLLAFLLRGGAGRLGSPALPACGRQITEGQWLRSHFGHQNRKISLVVPQGWGEANLGGEGRKWPFLSAACSPSLAVFVIIHF